MNEAKTQEKWTDAQIKYAQFLARGKKTIGGIKRSNEEFAKAIGVNAATLYRWKMQDGFMALVFELDMRELVDDLPQMRQAVKASVLGQELSYVNGKGKTIKLKPANVQAYLALMRQAKLLQSDKIDHTTNGKDMPAPIMSIARDE